MSQDDLENLFSDPFHGCALAAFVEVARETGGMPPSAEVKKRAYQYYEQERKGRICRSIKMP